MPLLYGLCGSAVTGLKEGCKRLANACNSWRASAENCWQRGALFSCKGGTGGPPQQLTSPPKARPMNGAIDTTNDAAAARDKVGALTVPTAGQWSSSGSGDVDVELNVGSATSSSGSGYVELGVESHVGDPSCSEIVEEPASCIKLLFATFIYLQVQTAVVRISHARRL